MRRHHAIGASSLILLVTLTACGGSHPPASHHTARASSAPPSSSPPSSGPPSPVQFSPSADPQQGAFDNWCSGDGYSAYQQVASDLTQIGTDSGNGQVGTVENTDAATLLQDADTATQSPPPSSKKHKLDYELWLGWLIATAGKLQQGDINGADADLKTANGYLNHISGLVSNACGS